MLDQTPSTRKLSAGLTIRGDSVYCPLPLSLDTFWNCSCDCYHCYLRKMNYVWGKEQRVIDLEKFEKELVNSQKPKHAPKPNSSSKNWALFHKKTIRWGNKSDPFQQDEYTHRASEEIFKILRKLNWTYVLQTMCTDLLEKEYLGYLYDAKDIITFQPIVSPGLNRDWMILERKRTTPPLRRIELAAMLKDSGFNVGINGEPFIPGFHTVKEFEEMMKLLKSHGIDRYNTYNFHFNDFVAKRLNSIGIDIEKIWYHNQDEQWREILQKLLDLSKKYDIKLGCPDFVNTGKNWIEPANTCCGVDVQNPCTFNTHTWKKLIQKGIPWSEAILKSTWDGVGDFETGRKVALEKSERFFSLQDVLNIQEAKPPRKRGFL